LTLQGHRLLPARVRLRDWEAWATKPNQPESGLPEYLAYRFKDHEPAPTRDQWRAWLKSGDVFLLLDGLDEIAGQLSFREALGFALRLFNRCPTILTCRTVSFEQHKAFCSDWPVFTLDGLDERGRDAYIRLYPPRYPAGFRPENLIAQLNRLPSMRALWASPLLLGQICFVFDDPLGQHLPAARSDLFDRSVDQLLALRPRIDVARMAGHLRLPVVRRRHILEHVALRLFAASDHQRQLIFDEYQLVEALQWAAKHENLAAPAEVAHVMLADLVGNSGLLRGDHSQG
jgi:hypothetical protein